MTSSIVPCNYTHTFHNFYTKPKQMVWRMDLVFWPQPNHPYMKIPPHTCLGIGPAQGRLGIRGTQVKVIR
jgi:hypothetical protein